MPDDIKIQEAQVISTLNPLNNVKIKVDPVSKNTAIINFDNLAMKEGCLISLVHTSSKEQERQSLLKKGNSDQEQERQNPFKRENPDQETKQQNLLKKGNSDQEHDQQNPFKKENPDQEAKQQNLLKKTN